MLQTTLFVSDSSTTNDLAVHVDFGKIASSARFTTYAGKPF